MTDLECLQMIRREYGNYLTASADRHYCRREVLAGIMMRETRGGTSGYLDKPGPGGRGDGGHGHGLMQIDDRSFPAFCLYSTDWQLADKNIDFGADVLEHKRRFIQRNCPQLDPVDLERASIAAYNCGEGNVVKSVVQGEDVDTHTSGHDYSKAVLEYADMYVTLDDL